MQLLGTVAPQLTDRERHQVWSNFLIKLEDLGVIEGREAIQAGNNARRDGALTVCRRAVSTRIATQRAEYGETVTSADAQTSIIVRMGEGATDQQREDLLRAAAQTGFSAAAIFGAQARFNEERRTRAQPRDISDELAMAETNLNEFMRELMIRRMQELRQAQNAIQLNGETPQLRQQRDEAAWGLARLMGGTQPKFEEAKEAGRDEPRPGTVNGQQVADTAFATIWMNVEARRALDMHQLDRVVPRHAA